MIVILRNAVFGEPWFVEDQGNYVSIKSPYNVFGASDILYEAKGDKRSICLKITHGDEARLGSRTEADELRLLERISACVNGCAGLNPEGVPGLVTLALMIYCDHSGLLSSCEMLAMMGISEDNGWSANLRNASRRALDKVGITFNEHRSDLPGSPNERKP